MNKSYSKIRHIQESNEKLEKRMLSEQVIVTGQTKPSQYNVGQVLNAKRDVDGKMYTIKIRTVGNGFVVADINGRGEYNGQPLQGTSPAGYELNSTRPGVLGGNTQMGTFTIVK
jgi:hypothetical protein